MKMRRKSGKPRKSRKPKQQFVEPVPDYYATLEVPPGAGSMAIRRAYRQLSQLYKLGADDIGEEIRAEEMWEAASTLLVPEKRASYDALFHSHPEEFERPKYHPYNYRMKDIDWSRGRHPPYVPGSHESIRADLVRIFYLEDKKQRSFSRLAPEYLQEQRDRLQRLDCTIQSRARRAAKAGIRIESLMAPVAEDRLQELLEKRATILRRIGKVKNWAAQSAEKAQFTGYQINRCYDVWSLENRAADRELYELSGLQEKDLEPFTRIFTFGSDWDQPSAESLRCREMWRLSRKQNIFSWFMKTFSGAGWGNSLANSKCIEQDAYVERKRYIKSKREKLSEEDEDVEPDFFQFAPESWDFAAGPYTPLHTPNVESTPEAVD